MQTKNCRVMHFVHWTRSGITSLVKDLCRVKDHAFLLLEKDPEFQLEYEKIRMKKSLDGTANLFISAFLAHAFYRRCKPEVVHCHSFTPLILSCVLFWKSGLLFHAHNEYPYFTDADLKSSIKRMVLKLACKCRRVTLIAVSEDAANSLRKITKRDVRVVLNGISDIGKQRADYSSDKSRSKFYSVCRLDEQKNLAHAVEIVEILVKKYESKVIYDIYGEGSCRKELEELTIRKGLKDHVNFKGYTKEPENLATSYDFYLNTSIYEGLSLSILSAMRGKTIAVITRVGELGNVLEDGVSCIFIEGDSDIDADKIQKFRNSSEVVLNGIQSKAREVFECNHSLDSFICDLEEVYKAVQNSSFKNSQARLS